MLIVKKTKIINAVYLLQFETQFDITSTFLRFQEFYESPEFKGKIFTLEEYKRWYSALKDGKFTYYTDWNGFNIPSFILRPFFEGKFDPLSEKEKRLLELFKHETGDYYIIGVHGEIQDPKDLLKHEIAHGLFYTSSTYKTQMLSLLKKYDTRAMKKKLRSMGGYHEDVLDDEVHAYILSPSKEFEKLIPEEAREELERMYEKFIS